MQNNNCKCIVFSSTSTIYGDTNDVPLVETMMGNPVHPYGQSKFAVEKIEDYQKMKVEDFLPKIL